MSGTGQSRRVQSRLQLGTLLQQLGEAMAATQKALDQRAVRQLELLQEEEPVTDVFGGTHSLLALGLEPAFFALSETHLDVRFSMSFTRQGGGKASVAGLDPRRLRDLGGGALGMPMSPSNADQAGRYGYPPKDASSIRASILSAPPPERLLQVARQLGEGQKAPKRTSSG